MNLGKNVASTKVVPIYLDGIYIIFDSIYFIREDFGDSMIDHLPDIISWGRVLMDTLEPDINKLSFLLIYTTNFQTNHGQRSSL